MTAPVEPQLTTWDWICLPPRILKLRGGDPDDRIHFTGHLVHLPEAYVPSIGNWGRLETEEMINVKEPHLGLIRVRYGAFRQFRHSRGLMTRSEFELLHGPVAVQPWIFAELSWKAHARAQRDLVTLNGCEASIGQACAWAADQSARYGVPKEARVGLLPVELVLWSRVFDAFLGKYGLCEDEWDGFSRETKHAFWAEGFRGTPWGPELVARAKARRELPFTRFAATG